MAGYIVPSKLYGILASGRPYVAAVEDSCEVAAITRIRDCGLVVEPGQARPLADAIRTLRCDPALAARLGANARRASLEFDRAKQVATYAALLHGVAAPAPVPLPTSAA
jgi:colanic acid biosynthesis glycosyl transferase WcaI